ncbi:MAG: zeta toxin family protein [Nitrospirae bacterium]|nr:zeta toxin family protein [Nitrospirota bacterium]
MITLPPHIVVIAGPNGSGKSTTAPFLLNGALQVKEFVNADIIAQGLSAFNPEMTAFQAGRIMLERLHFLANRRADFAFETTLASKSFAPWIAGLLESGYEFHLVFFWLPNEEFAVNRVADRVRMGGHNVPNATIRRRYHAGIVNFFSIYKPLADTWMFYDNSTSSPHLVAYGEREAKPVVIETAIWHNCIENYGRLTDTNR